MFVRDFYGITKDGYLWFQIVYAIYQYKIYQSQLHKSLCTAYWCHEYLAACIYVPINVN